MPVLTSRAEALRRQAEEVLRQQLAKESKRCASKSVEEIQQVLHELQVHQIELEIQNEELRRAQVELDATRARYFNLYDLAPIGYCTISEQGLFLEANLKAATLLGINRGALKGKTIFQSILNDDQDIFYLHRKQLIETGRLQTCELRMVKNDATVFWAHMTIHAAEETDGAAVHRIVLRDITERKRAEGALRESEQGFKTLSNSGMALIWTSGTDKLCYYFNNVWLDFTGRKLEQEIGNGWTEGVHPDDFQRCLDIYVGAFNRQENFSMEYRLRRYDGEYRWIIDEGCPRYDSQGEFIGYIGHCLDIDDRKRLQEKLQESLLRYELVLEGASGGIWDWNVPNKTVHFSSRWKELRGFLDEEIGDSETILIENIHPDNKLSVMAKVESHFAGETVSFEAEYRVRCKDGSWKWIHDRGKAIRDSNGQVIRMAGSNIDITGRKLEEEERRKLQVQLQQAQKLEAIGTLAGGIAHDFNNMLGAIIGYSEMILDDFPPGSPSIHDINQVIKASHRAKDLVKQILAFSRQVEDQKIPVQPAVIVKEAITLLRSSLPTTITINQDIYADAGVVLADPTHIHQIVMNLATNAFHAMEVKGGMLTISLQMKILSQDDLATLPDLQPGTFVQLSIKDTGEGILPEIRERIFEPFFTTKEVGKGTGLGLSMVYSIVKSCNGSIACNSRLGKGTEFCILLPAMECHATEENESTDLIPHGKEHILLIDDEEMLAELGQAMLKRLGYHVTTRINSLDALATFQNQPDSFDLIITDQTMPGMTGVDLARRILQIRPEMPIILCTGYSSLITEDKAKAAGIKGFAFKPLAKKDIGELIRKVLDGKKS